MKKKLIPFEQIPEKKKNKIVVSNCIIKKFNEEKAILFCSAIVEINGTKYKSIFRVSEKHIGIKSEKLESAINEEIWELFSKKLMAEIRTALFDYGTKNKKDYVNNNKEAE